MFKDRMVFFRCIGGEFINTDKKEVVYEKN